MASEPNISASPRTKASPMPRGSFFYWDGEAAIRITAKIADRDYRDTDAGLDEQFVVRADSQENAAQGARDWLENRADEDTDEVPDYVGLEERLYQPTKSYILLWVRL